MARVTAEALSPHERQRYEIGRRHETGGRALPRAALGGLATGLSLVLVTVGAMAVAAMPLLEWRAALAGALLLALGAFGLGARMAGGLDVGLLQARWAELARREAEVNRVLVALALRGAGGGGPAAPEPPVEQPREAARLHRLPRRAPGGPRPDPLDAALPGEGPQ